MNSQHVRVMIAAGAMLALTACQTTQTAAPIAPNVPPAAKVDDKIAAVSAELAKQCMLLAIGLMTAKSFVTDEKGIKAIDAAEEARKEFCLAPPTDLNTAILTVAKMAIAVNASLKPQKV
jgi:hypothetical protein